jgi:hypothetical protein
VNFFKALLASIVVSLFSLAHAARADVQSTPTVHLVCAGDGFAHVDVEPFHGDLSKLVAVSIVIDTTQSTIRYTATNALDTQNQFDASGGWYPGFKHDPSADYFAIGSYTYGGCGGIPLAAGETGSFHIGGGWAPYTLPDASGDLSPWVLQNAPGGFHRVFLKSWGWATFSPGLWANPSYSVRARYSLHVEYVTAP